MQILGVGDVAQHISIILASDPLLSDVWIRGEIVGLTRSQVGHYYFSLRDESSQLRCVLFRGAAARAGVTPANGAAVVLHGKAGFYEAAGTMQILVDLLYPEGVGLARLQLEALKLRLEAEGLFAEERKRPLPAYPRRIGVVTSASGAVLHDILKVLGRRYPLLEVVLAPAAVQGERAPIEICAALSRLARHHQDGNLLDAIIVARGGGAETELAIFNDERVARAVFGCPVPVVSAIGHETDYTLVDLVADLRAPTPSAAAEMIAPDIAVLRGLVADLAERAEEAARRALRQARVESEQARERLLHRTPAVEMARHRAEVHAVLQRGQAALKARLRLAREQLHGRGLQLEALSPERTLDRGYAICTLEDGTVLRSVQQIQTSEQIDITVLDGVVEGRAHGVRSQRANGDGAPAGRSQHGIAVRDV